MGWLVAMLTGMLGGEEPDLFVKLGVDSTILGARTKKDRRAGWGCDLIGRKSCKGMQGPLAV